MNDKIKNSKKKESTINAYEKFEEIYPTLDLVNLSFLDVVNEIQNKVTSTQPVTADSLKNCRGKWYELAFIMAAHQSILKQTRNLYIVKMGTEKSIKFWEVYDRESRRKYEELVNRLKQCEQPIVIRCSTPDFVVVSQDIIAKSTSSEISQSQSPALQTINELYKILKNTCKPYQVKGFISLKTSNRPDRRYPILLEANVTKFASKHIHTLEHRLRYDVIGKSNYSDKEVFCAPLMSTLPLTGNNISSVERAIDSSVNILLSSELDDYWTRYEEIIELDREGKAVSPQTDFANDDLDL